MTSGRPSVEAIGRRARDYRIASLSDIHLGHSSTPTPLILANLYAAFPDTPETGELDLILLGGDLFDGMLYYDDELIVEVEKWMWYMLWLCDKWDIALRVLEGTFSHDRGQGVHFEKCHRQGPFNTDFRYVRNIEVEIHKRLGLSILYVPDYTTTEMDRLWKESQEALQRVGLTSVDYANIHGAFTYQMPPISKVQASCHAMDRYLSIVDQYIFTGHIHLSSVYDRIYCNGSFDRLAHGEEEPKGHWRLHARKNGEDDFIFAVNEGAKVYKTIDLHGVSAEEAGQTVRSIVKVLPKQSAVRIMAERGHSFLQGMGALRKDYPDIEWSAKVESVKDVQKSLLVDHRSDFVEVAITPDSIVGLLTPKIIERTRDRPELTNRCFELLTGILNS
jgi:hypothetical protein